MSSDPKPAIASKFLDSFLQQIILDTALSTHNKITRARSICHLCGIRCQAHTPAAEQSSHLPPSLDSTTPGSRSGTPAPSGSGSKPDYYSNNPLFECLVCSRQVSSNRYATHLAKCMGMGSKGGRKGAARNAKSATSTTTNSGIAGRGTPSRYGSDLDDDTLPGGKKKKNSNGLAKGNGVKRANSPAALNAARMNKRIKTSSPTPPPSDSLALTGTGMNRSFSSQTFAPSGLSTVVSGSPLNPNNNISGSAKNGAAGTKANGSSKLGKNDKKRKSLIEDDDEERSYNGSDGEDGEEGEISDDDDDQGSDDDDDVALASRPASSATTKIIIPNRSTPSSTSKPKTFTIADDSDEDSDTILSSAVVRRKSVHQVSDDDDDEEEDDDDDEDDDVQVTRVNHSSSNKSLGAAKKVKKSGDGGVSGLQRERGSDGEFIDVESASEQSDADSF